MNETKNQNPTDLMTEQDAVENMINVAELKANDIPGADGPSVLAAVIDFLGDDTDGRERSVVETHSIESAGRISLFHVINDSEIRVSVYSLTWKPEGVKVLSSRVFAKDIARAIWKTMEALTACTVTKGLRLGIEKFNGRAV